MVVGGDLVAKLCQTLVTPWTAAHQAPPSMGSSRGEHWRGLSFPSPRGLNNPGISCDAGRLYTEPPGRHSGHFIHEVIIT